MKRRTSSRFACVLTAAATLLVSEGSPASDTFPGEIQSHLGMACPPSCTLCHATPQGGGTPDKVFAGHMIRPGGLLKDHPELVAPALDVVESMAFDSDMDGTGDVAELEAARNPNVNPTTAGESDELVCPPTYGCGARVAPREPVDGSALAFALVVAGYLVLRSRRSA